MEEMPTLLIQVKELHEYSEEYPVEIWHDDECGYTLVATNEGGYVATSVDLPSLIRWVLDNFTKGENIEEQIKLYIEKHAPSGAGSLFGFPRRAKEKKCSSSFQSTMTSPQT